jgi:hypothetical protein
MKPIGRFVKTASAYPSATGITGGTVRTASVAGVAEVAASKVDGTMDTFDTVTNGPRFGSPANSLTVTTEPAGIAAGTMEQASPEGAAAAGTATTATVALPL